MAGQTFVEAEIWTVAQTDQGNVVLVRPKGSELAVPIFIGQLETQSILIGMGRVDVPRPLTHDLIISLVHELGSDIARIEINDLREGTFFARMVLRPLDKTVERDLVVDARPSDAIGVAVRRGCPVFIAESVVDEAGISVNLVSSEGEGGPGKMSPVEPYRAPAAEPSAIAQDERKRLGQDLEQAIAEEDYERAAIIRDRLKDLGI